MPIAPLPSYLTDIPAITFRDWKGNITENKEGWPFEKDLDKYPSPYVTGLFNYLMENRKEGQNGWQAIIETNRGCPF